MKKIKDYQADNELNALALKSHFMIKFVTRKGITVVLIVFIQL